METLTTIEALKLKRQGLVIEMQNSAKDLRKISEFRFWCKEVRKIDEQIKSIKVN
jgi:hypothetical protein